MVYIQKKTGPVDGPIHKKMVERGHKRKLLKDFNVSRLMTLGLSEDQAKAALKR